MIDVIIILLIGGFIVSRFMGFNLPDAPKQKKKAGQKSRKPTRADILDFPKAPNQSKEVAHTPAKDTSRKSFNELTGLAAIKATDPEFNEKDFLNGAKFAYNYYYEHYNKMDEESLSNLLSPILLNDTIEEFNALDTKGHTPEIKLAHIDKAVIADARLNGKTMLIDVQFTATQSINTRTKTNKFVGGKEKPAKTVKSLWTFARPAGSEDPNWDVQSIQIAS